MAGQIIESSFGGDRYASQLSSEVADAFGRAQSIQATLQAEQARNALTQQQIQIESARQQTFAQSAAVENHYQSVRSDLLSKFGAQDAQDIHNGRLNEAKTSEIANAQAELALKIAGVTDEKNPIAKTLAYQVHKANLDNQIATSAQLRASTENMQQGMEDRKEQQIQDLANHSIALLATKGGSAEEIGKVKGAVLAARALNGEKLEPGALTRTALDGATPENLANIRQTMEFFSKQQLTSSDPKTATSQFNFQNTQDAARAGVPMPAPSPFILGPGGKAIPNPNAGHSMIDDVSKAFEESQKRIASAAEGGVDRPEGVDHAVGSFEFKPTGNDTIDRTGYHAQQSGVLGDVTMGEIGKMLPSKQGRVNAVLSRDPSGAKVDDGRVIFKPEFQKQIDNIYGKQANSYAGSSMGSPSTAGVTADSTTSPERRIVDQALVVDKSATIQQQMVYNATVKEMLKLDLTDPTKVPQAKALFEKTYPVLSDTQRGQLRSLINNFK